MVVICVLIISEHYENHWRATGWALIIHHLRHYLFLIFSQISYHKFNSQSAISFVCINYLGGRWTAQGVIMMNVNPAV